MELRIGSEGQAVTQVQNKLNSLGFDVGVADGQFGEKTYSGVRAFQLRNNLDSSGIVNQETYNKIFGIGNSSSTTNPLSHGGNMLTTYIEKIKANKIYMGIAIVGIAGISFLAYKKIKK